MKAELVPENGDSPIPITKDLTVVGRRDYCDVKIDHHSLSKRHCVLVKTDGLLIIRDLATTNGTKVKGQRVRWAALLPDDRITLGAYKLRVYLGPAEVAAPSERPAGGRSRQTVKEVAPRAGGDRPGVPVADFPAPTPVGVPAMGGDDGLEILADDNDESGWKKLMASRNDEIIIELD